MITDRIELHEVLLPINHDHYNFRVKKMRSFFCKIAFNTNKISKQLSDFNPTQKLGKNKAVNPPTMVMIKSVIMRLWKLREQTMQDHCEE